jgi:LysM repeat protein
MLAGKNKALFFFILTLSLFLLSRPGAVLAGPMSQSITTPAQLIDAVNGLRASYGLAPLAVHSVLMQSAQSQADYMAATDNVTHARPGGISYTQQLLSLGFPLAGDLSLGGFRAENILSSSGPLEWNGVPGGWQDADHMNTMLSQNLSHIGAGISQGPRGYYYALDCAMSTETGRMQESAGAIVGVGAGTEVAAGDAAVSQFMVPITKSTANADGNVFHKVQYGQTLWSIAIDYGTTIKNIQSLNNLGESELVYQGQELLVLKGATPPPPSTLIVGLPPTGTSAPAVVPVTPQIVFPFTAVASPPQAAHDPSTNSNGPSRLLVILLIVGSFVGGGMAIWLIRDPKT